MGTSYADRANPLKIRVGPNASGQYTEVTVLGVKYEAGQPIAGGGYQWLAVQTDVTEYCGPGKRYEIDGRRHRHFGVQSGTWAANASGAAQQGTTTFTLDAYAWLSQHMVGWSSRRERT